MGHKNKTKKEIRSHSPAAEEGPGRGQEPAASFPSNLLQNSYCQSAIYRQLQKLNRVCSWTFLSVLWGFMGPYPSNDYCLLFQQPSIKTSGSNTQPHRAQSKGFSTSQDLSCPTSPRGGFHHDQLFIDIKVLTEHPAQQTALDTCVCVWLQGQWCQDHQINISQLELLLSFSKKPV